MGSNWPTLHQHRGEKLLFCYSWAHSASSTLFYGACKALPILTLDGTESFERTFLFLRLLLSSKHLPQRWLRKYFLTRARARLSPRRRERVVFVPGRVTWESEALNEITLIFSRLAENKETSDEGGRRFNSTDKQDFVSGARGMRPDVM